MSPSPLSSRRPTGLIVVATVLALAAVLLGGSLLNLRSDFNESRTELNRVRTERDNLVSAEAERLARESALPDVLAIVEKTGSNVPGYRIVGDSTYAEISITGVGLFDLKPLLDAMNLLGFANSVGSQIGNTRALDGTRDAKGDHVSATWTYHPDHGLDVVITRD